MNQKTRLDEREERLAALEKLKQSKGGRLKGIAALRAQTGENDDNNSRYEYLDDEEYEKRKKERMADNFIADDDGAGYVDDGRDLSDEYSQDESDSDAEGPRSTKKRVGSNESENGKNGFKSSKGGASKKQATVISGQTTISFAKSVYKGSGHSGLLAEASARNKRPAYKELDVDLDFSDLLDNPLDTKATQATQDNFFPMLNMNQPLTTRLSFNKPQNEHPTPLNLSPARDEGPPKRQKLDFDPTASPQPSTKWDTDDQLYFKDEELMMDDIDVTSATENAAPTEVFSRPNKTEILYREDTAASLHQEPEEFRPITPLRVLNNGIPSETALPIVTNDENGTQKLLFYYYDAFEDPFNRTGDIFLFGKVATGPNALESCFIKVTNMSRTIYAYPREALIDEHGKEVEISMHDVSEEIKSKLNLEGIRNYKLAEVEKKYAFQPIEDVKIRAKIDFKDYYLEISYPYSGRTLDSNLSGGTFSHLLNSTQTSLEKFLLQLDLMGPAWLEISNLTLVSSPISWCKHEYLLTSYHNISKYKPAANTSPLVSLSPNLKTLTLSLCTKINPATLKHEILMVTMSYNPNYNIDSGSGVESSASFKQMHSMIQRKAIICKDNGMLPHNFSNLVEQTHKSMNAEIDIVLNEFTLLNVTMHTLQKMDPDIIISHDLYSNTLDILLMRLRDLKIKSWDKIGRLRRSVIPGFSGSAGSSYAFDKKRQNHHDFKKGDGPRHASASSANLTKQLIMGRLGLSLYESAKEFIPGTTYTLEELAANMLQLEFIEIEHERVLMAYRNANELLSVVDRYLKQSDLIYNLVDKLVFIPLTKQITMIVGNTWSRTLQAGRSARCDSLLSHEFHKHNFILPEGRSSTLYTKKESSMAKAVANNNSKPKKKKAAYAGGLVLEPKKGFYSDIVLLLDFNSLYPSIIQEFNFCHSTVEIPHDFVMDGSTQLSDETYKVSSEAGVLPLVLKSLVDRRKQVRSLLVSERDPSKQNQYEVRQKAFKLIANSMYGSLGFEMSRYFAQHLAELITFKGRHILQHTVSIANMECSAEVIYGDTDSIMVNSRTRDVIEAETLAKKIQRRVNNSYKVLEIAQDGLFKNLLLYKKKKYAAMKIHKRPDGTLEYEKEVKGLDIIRHDWCGLAKEIGDFILDQLFAVEDKDELITKVKTELASLCANVKEGTVPLQKFVIYKMLNSSPESYANPQQHPHVVVALKMKEKGNIVGQGTTIPYVICKRNLEESSVDKSDLKGQALPAATPTKANNSTNSISERAVHPNDLAGNTDLANTLDVRYYLESQVMAVVTRLLEDIKGLEPHVIASILDLDVKKYASASHNSYLTGEDAMTKHIVDRLLGETFSEKYRDVQKLTLSCFACKKPTPFEGLFSNIYPHHELFFNCKATQGCAGRFSAAYVCNLMTKVSRDCIERYYNNFFKCENQTCGLVAQQLDVFNCKMCPACGSKCNEEYTPLDLYRQLMYFKDLVDMDKNVKNQIGLLKESNPAELERTTLDVLQRTLQNYLSDPQMSYELRGLSAHATNLLNKNKRNFINLAEYFSFEHQL